MEYLLHFTKYENLSKILENGIRFGNMTNTNDQFEKNDLICEIQGDSKQGFYDRETISDKNYKSYYRTFCCTLRNDKCIKNNDLEAIINIPSMWYHYAENYNGVCFILNKKKFELELEKINLFFEHKRIDYVLTKDIIANIFQKLNNAFLENNEMAIKEIYRNNNILFIKDCSWGYEEEYRYIFEINENIKEIFVSIENCIEAIIIPSNKYLPISQNNLLNEYSKNIHYLTWEKGFPKLVTHTAYKELKNIFENMFQENKI